jgi:hypothetical protein
MNSGILGFPLGRDRFAQENGAVEEYALLHRSILAGGGGAIGSNTWTTLALTHIVDDKTEMVAKLTPGGGFMLKPCRYHTSGYGTQMSTEAAAIRLWDLTSGRWLAWQGSYAGQGGGRLHTTTMFFDDEFDLYRDSELVIQQIAGSAQGADWATGHYWPAMGLPEIHQVVQLWRVPER